MKRFFIGRAIGTLVVFGAIIVYLVLRYVFRIL